MTTFSYQSCRGIFVAALLLGTVACASLDLTIEDIDFSVLIVEAHSNSFPVGSQDEAVFDTGLVGVWQEPGDPSLTLTLRPTGSTYKVEYRMDDAPGITRGTAFAVRLKGMRFLNITLDQAPGYLSYRYNTPGDGALTLEELELNDISFGSATEFLAYVETHATDAALFDEGLALKRIALW